MAGLRKRLDDERGVTLVELLVAILLLGITTVAAMTLLTMTVRGEQPARERSAEIQKGRTMVDRVMRELRQGRTISAATSSQLQILTYVNSASCGGAAAATVRLCRVTYTCSGSTCMRTERNPNGSGSAPAVQAAGGLTSAQVFRYLPTESEALFVGIKLQFPPHGGGDPVTLEDGVTLRNSFYPSG